MYLNLERSEFRKAARVTLGIDEAFSEVRSLAFLVAQTVDPLLATVQQERQQKESDANRKTSEEEKN